MAKKKVTLYTGSQYADQVNPKTEWSQIEDKPTNFPPSTHTHEAETIESAKKLAKNGTVIDGSSGLQFYEVHADITMHPFTDYFHHIVMNHPNPIGYHVDLAFSFHNDRAFFRRKTGGVVTQWNELYHSNNPPTANDIGATERLTISKSYLESYKSFVVPLVCVDNTEINANAGVGGRLYAKRGNSVVPNLDLMINAEKIYDTDLVRWNLLNLFESNAGKCCYFNYNNLKYFGIEVSTYGANYTNIYFDGVIIKQEIGKSNIGLVLYYYDHDTQTVIRNEINDSLVYATNPGSSKFAGHLNTSGLLFEQDYRVYSPNNLPTIIHDSGDNRKVGINYSASEITDFNWFTAFNTNSPANGAAVELRGVYKGKVAEIIGAMKGAPTDISNQSLYSLTKPGFYVGNNITGAPNNGWFYIFVENHTDSLWCKQTATSYGSNNEPNEIYTRVKANNTWTDWKRLLTEIPEQKYLTFSREGAEGRYNGTENFVVTVGNGLSGQNTATGYELLVTNPFPGFGTTQTLAARGNHTHNFAEILWTGQYALRDNTYDLVYIPISNLSTYKYFILDILDNFDGEFNIYSVVLNNPAILDGESYSIATFKGMPYAEIGTGFFPDYYGVHLRVLNSSGISIGLAGGSWNAGITLFLKTVKGVK